MVTAMHLRAKGTEDCIRGKPPCSMPHGVNSWKAEHYRSEFHTANH